VSKASRDVLESFGCSVERVPNADRALARLADPAARVDLVLSDIEMPGSIDGIELAARISQRHPGLPVVLMTGYAGRLQEAVRRRLSVLPKPVAPGALADAVAAGLAAARGKA
jgi:two-component system NtrC family sensor kinase